MELRTSNIIMLCKGRHTYGDVDSKTAIKKYMAEICAGEEEWYDDSTVLSIIQDAVLDFLKTADYPSRLLFDYFEAQKYYGYKEDPIGAWCSALRMVKVRNSAEDGTYVCINGFTDETIDVVSENTGKPMFNFENENK
jgi:hypothetical protein